MSSDEVVSVVQVKKDDVDDDKSVISSSMTTSTYDTAHDDEEDATETHREDVTANGATDNVENGVGGPEDTNDHEDEDGQLSDDQKSNGSSIAGSSAGSQVPDVEREEGDGQEEGDKKDKKLDHDEDRRDPQYIPKRGVFYEHDDRTLDDDPEDKKEPVREPKKSKAFEAVERWGHDMYNDDEQSPKTTEELVDMYGYDIRKEEAPPKARRRRRYGKGPNKYERSWEDERAYNKTPTRGGFKGQKRPPRNFVQRDEDFPALGPKTDEIGVSAGPPTGDATHTPQRNDSPRSEIKFSPKPPPVDEISLAKEEIKAIFDQLDEEERIRSSEFYNKNFDWHYSKGPMGDRGVDGGRPSRSEAVRGRAPLPRRGRTSHDQLPPFAGKNHHGDRPDKHGKGASTADEDIATLAQHFSNAVINVDRNIAPIRSTSEPPAEDRPQRETRREDGTKHQGHHHNHHNKHGGEKLHHSEKHHGGPPLTDKHHQPPDQPSTKSKRYSTQRQRPAQHMNSGAQPQNSAPPAPPAQTAPGYLPPPQGYYPPQHGMCPPEGTPHMSAPPPAQFPPPPGGMQMVTFLPGVPPPPTNTFHPPPNVYVPPTSYIPPPPLVQPIQASELKGEENERILEEEIGKENVGSVRTDEETSNVKEKPEPTRRGARRGHPVEVASSAPVSGDNGGDRVGADVQPEKDLDNVEVSKSDDESSKKKEKVPPKRGARRAVQKNDAGNLPVQKEQKPSEQVATETALVSLENNEVITQNVEEPIDNPVEEVELVKAASKKALSKNPKKANNIKASELKGEENERILEEEIGKENVGSVRTDEETSNVKEKPEPTRRGARRGHPVEVASSAPVSGDNGGDRVGADVQPEKDLDNVEVSKSDDESSKKKEKVPPKRGARRAVQKNDAGNLPVQKEQKPSEQVATETALVSLENNEVITQNVEEPIDNPVEEVELVKAASKKALSKNPKKANNIKASELKGEENERILEEEIGKENVGSVRTDEETSNVKEKPEPTRRGARRGHPVEVASSAPVSGDNGGDRVGADVQPEKDLDNVEVSKSDDESSKKKEKVPPKRGARRAVQKNDAGNLPVQKEQKPSEQVATETALVSLENNEVITQNVEEPIDNPVEEVELVKAASKKALSKNPKKANNIKASELKGEENERILEEEIGKENVGSVRTDEETSNVKEKPEPTRRGARRGHPVEVASSAPVSGDNGGDRVGADVQPEKDLDNVEVSKSDDESSKKKEKVPPKRGARRAVQKNDAGNLPVQKEQKPSEQVATETALVSLENNEVITQNVEEPIDNPVEEVELVKAASKKALSKNPKKANNIKASELKGEENERILEEEIGKENVGSVRTDEETSNVKEKPEPTRRGARRGHPVEVASSAPVSGDNGGDRVGADVQPEKDLDNVEVSKSDDESSKKKEKVPPKRGARRAVQKNDAGNLPVQKEQKPSEQVATETALVSLENNEVITQNVEEPIDNPVEEVELVKAASKKALSKNPKKANNIKASELKGEENERILEEEIGKENVGSVRTDEETSNVKEKPEPTRRGARRGHPVEVASSAPVSGDNGGDRVGADVQPEKDLDNVEVSKSDDESSKKKEKVPPKRGARRAVQKNDAGNL